MAFELKQNLKLAQQLIMTPQLQQAIKLLQLSRQELVEAINQEMEENPLLEEISQEEGNEEQVYEEVAENVVSVERENVKSLEHTEEINVEKGAGTEEFDWASYLEDYGPVGVTYGGKDCEEKSWDNVLTEGQSLTKHLTWQMTLSSFSEDEERVCNQIIGNLDQNGYLCASVAEIAQLENVSDQFVE
jgi:RNA polymerase sigma-54 factor